MGLRLSFLGAEKLRNLRTGAADELRLQELSQVSDTAVQPLLYSPGFIPHVFPLSPAHARPNDS
jgi:hypothetical protein